MSKGTYFFNVKGFSNQLQFIITKLSLFLSIFTTLNQNFREPSITRMFSTHNVYIHQINHCLLAIILFQHIEMIYLIPHIDMITSQQ